MLTLRQALRCQRLLQLGFKVLQRLEVLLPCATKARGATFWYDLLLLLGGVVSS